MACSPVQRLSRLHSSLQNSRSAVTVESPTDTNEAKEDLTPEWSAQNSQTVHASGSMLLHLYLITAERLLSIS